MLCQNCGKNEANVRYTQVINGKKQEMVLCEECSHNLGIDSISLSMPIDFSSFFGGMLEDYNNDFMPIGITPETLKCDYCGMTYDRFVEGGKFGCSNCYNVFKGKIDPMLKRLQGSNRYTGRKSKQHEIRKMEVERKENDTQLEDLQKKLRIAIKEERYEDAAKYRDEIRKMEKRGDK